MLKEKVEKILNLQITKEAYSSQLYLAMASWCEKEGYNGSASFLYRQSDEERMHMLKLLHYINDRGSHAIVDTLDKPACEFGSIRELFSKVLEHERFITESINECVEVCMTEKDYTTNQFLQWYVAEQVEEERNAQTIIDKLNLLGDDKARLYLFDRDMENFMVNAPTAQ
jgi:ferritin